MDQFAKETLPVSLEEEMRRSYLDYAMSVIVGRALPDVRDGLKPVHRRVLYAMHEANNVWNRPFVKCARVVGEVMGKYHPHGDSAIYDTLVRMAQDFSLRYTLVDGQGNFGSIDGDNAAAMRYTECRLDRIAGEMLADIERETVDFGPNYDGKEREPLVLPARFPNLLVNGSAGIAVGMATNIPPHNLSDVIAACQKLLGAPDTGIEELIDIVKAPDFPTAGIIYGVSGVREGYRTGRGRVVMRARVHFEDLDRGSRQAIIIDELPYQVNKKALLERIAEQVHEKRLEGIAHVQDESDKSGMRVVIELRRGELPEVVLNNLYKQTQLQDTFGINMVALVDGQPRLLNLRQMLDAFLQHRREVVTRRTVYELRRARERAHIQEGLAVALSNVDEIIALIKASPTPPEAKVKLMERGWRSSVVEEMLRRASAGVQEDASAGVQEDASTGAQEGASAGVEGGAGAAVSRPEGLAPIFGMQPDGYRLSDAQAQAILEMRLQRLTGLEQDKIVEEYRELLEKIADYLDILAKRERITAIIAEELEAVRAQYGDARRSEIVIHAEDLSMEDLITPEDVVVTFSHAGYVKAQPLGDYRAQRRGGRGKQAATTREDDFIERLFIAHTHDTLLCFSSEGRLYWLKVYQVPQGNRTSRGKPIINLFPLVEGEKINAVLPIKQYDDNHFVFMATAMGTVKKTPLSAFTNVREKGIIAVELDPDDHLIGAAITDGQHDVMLFSNAGKAVRFEEDDVRPMGRQARGVRGMVLDEGQRVVSMLVAPAEAGDGREAEGGGLTVLTATENGYGKRTPIAEYTRHGRATKGMIAIQTSDRNGVLVGAVLVEEKDEIMLISTSGVLIRTRAADIREMGRSTQGVTLINLDEGTKLAGVECIGESEADDAGNGHANGNGNGNGAGGDDGEVPPLQAGDAELPAKEENGGADDSAGGDDPPTLH